MRFESILFGQPGGGSGVDGLAEPDFFVDLNLDQVLRSMTAGREQYELKPFFYAPLHEIEPLPTSYGEDSYRRIFGTADSNRASSSARAYVAGGPVGADPQHRGTGP